MEGKSIFGKIGDIRPDVAESYEKKVFLTFDIDWCHDVVLTDTIELLKTYQIPATFFVTHETEILEDLRSDDLFELGIHPNFNFLVKGDDRNGKDAKEVVERLMQIVPEAKTARSHSVLQASWIWEIFADFGLTHECNDFIAAQSDIRLKPWTLWNDVIKVPYFWEDDVACLYKDSFDLSTTLGASGLRVFDFHPIHVFLNTGTLDDYENSRGLHKIPDKLKLHRNTRCRGTRDFLIDLLETAS